MWRLLGYVRDVFREDFSLRVYLPFAALVAACIFVNYRYDFEWRAIVRLRDPLLQVPAYLAFFAFPWGTAMLIGLADRRDRPAVPWGRVLGLAALGLLVLAVDGSVYLNDLLRRAGIVRLDGWARACAQNANSLLTVLLPLALAYRHLTRRDTGFFGLAGPVPDLGAYLQLVALMAPLTLAASFLQDFRDTYPIAPVALLAHDGPWTGTGWLALFEICYGWDFLATELVFRGFFVVLLARYLGRRCLLPMVAAYAFLHFGKPLGEAVASVFGGYALGAIALRSGRIWGGVAAHVGLAWLMELFGYLQLAARG